METAKDNLPFDVVTLLLDGQRDIDQRIRDALVRRIRLYGLTLTVGAFGDSLMYPPQHVRKVELTDGYAHVEFRVVVEDFLRDQEKYINHLAERMVVMFARERHLIKR